jgi:hypothetical protein
MDLLLAHVIDAVPDPSYVIIRGARIVTPGRLAFAQGMTGDGSSSSSSSSSSSP